MKVWGRVKVVQHQTAAGAEGITAVLGPPLHYFPPLFRQNGPYAKYKESSDGRLG